MADSAARVGMVREARWHCLQFNINPDDHPSCDRRLTQGCRGCTWAQWNLSTRVATDADNPPDDEVKH